jgi:hypothetical protein
MVEYKGYAAGPIDVDSDYKTFSGTVAGLRDVIHFEGRRPRNWCAPNRNCIARQRCARQSKE